MPTIRVISSQTAMISQPPGGVFEPKPNQRISITFDKIENKKKGFKLFGFAETYSNIYSGY